MTTLPSVLILGGCETGTFSALLVYLWDLSVKADKRRAGHVRVTDRLLFLPQNKIYLRGWVHPDARKVLEQGLDNGVEYVQANLANAESRAKIFSPPPSTGKKAYDIVFDLQTSSIASASEAVMIGSAAKLARLLGLEALKNGGVGAFIRLSTLFVTQPSKACPLKETNDQIQPTNDWAKWGMEGDRALAALSDLNLIIARIANPWGPGVMIGLTRRMTVASVYAYLGKGETMEVLWGKDLVLEHIHSYDLASAFWALAQWQLHTVKTRTKADELAKAPLPPCRPSAAPADMGDEGGKASKWDDKEIEDLPKRQETLWAPVFHVSDGSAQTQEDIGKVLEKAMGIKVDYLSAITNALAKMNMTEVFEIAEEKHSEPWLEMLSKSKPPISNTPFSPSLPPSILRKNRCHLDNTKLKTMTGWKPKYPKVTADEVKKTLKTFVDDGIWPNAPPRKK